MRHGIAQGLVLQDELPPTPGGNELGRNARAERMAPPGDVDRFAGSESWTAPPALVADATSTTPSSTATLTPVESRRTSKCVPTTLVSTPFVPTRNGRGAFGATWKKASPFSRSTRLVSGANDTATALPAAKVIQLPSGSSRWRISAVSVTKSDCRRRASEWPEHERQAGGDRDGGYRKLSAPAPSNASAIRRDLRLRLCRALGGAVAREHRLPFGRQLRLHRGRNLREVLDCHPRLRVRNAGGPPHLEAPTQQRIVRRLLQQDQPFRSFLRGTRFRRSRRRSHSIPHLRTASACIIGGAGALPLEDELATGNYKNSVWPR